VSVTVDVSEAPDMAEWAAKSKQLAERWYPVITEILASNGFVAPAEIRLEFKKTLRVPALCHGTTVEVNSEWVRKKPDDYGMVIHEITHVAQQLEGAPAGWWRAWPTTSAGTSSKSRSSPRWTRPATATMTAIA
jgi:hypothetical protein